MTKTKKIYLFAVALFFVSVFFAGVDGVNNVAKADCYDICADPAIDMDKCYSDCVASTDVSDMTMDGAYNTDCSSYANTRAISGKCECYDGYTQSSDGSCYVTSENACSNNYDTSECCTANAGYWYNSTCNTSPNAGTVGNGCADDSQCGSGYKCDAGTCMADSVFSATECRTDGDCQSNYGSNYVCSGYIVKTCEKSTAVAPLTAAEKAEADKAEAKKRAEAEASVAAQKGAYQKVQTTSAAVQSACSVPDSQTCKDAKKAYEDAQIAMKAADAQAKAAVEAYNGAAVAGGASASVGGGYMLCANGILGRICEGGGGTPYVAGISTGGFSGGVGFGSYGSGTSGVTPPKCGNGFQDISGVCFPMTTGLSNAPIGTILNNLFSWLMGLFTTFAMIAFVVSGIQYFMASGDESMAEKAKENATNAIIGVIVGLSGFIILKAIAAALSGQSFFF